MIQMSKPMQYDDGGKNMLRHPFSLKFDELLTQNLEFEEVLDEELAQQRRGGLLASTLAIGEEG